MSNFNIDNTSVYYPYLHFITTTFLVMKTQIYSTYNVNKNGAYVMPDVSSDMIKSRSFDTIVK